MTICASFEELRWLAASGSSGGRMLISVSRRDTAIFCSYFWLKPGISTLTSTSDAPQSVQHCK